MCFNVDTLQVVLRKSVYCFRQRLLNSMNSFILNNVASVQRFLVWKQNVCPLERYSLYCLKATLYRQSLLFNHQYMLYFKLWSWTENKLLYTIKHVFLVVS